MSRCAKCKGNLLCGRIKCPLLEKFRFFTPIAEKGNLEKPTPPSVFVGRMGYPKVYVGPLMTLSSNLEPEFMDSPWKWGGSIEDIIGIRSSMLRGMRGVDIKEKEQDRYTISLQEMAASTKHVDVETDILKVIRRPVFDDVLQPTGVTATIGKFELSNNPSIPNKVEKIYYDDLKAVDSVKYLFDSGFNTYYLQRIFSVGMLGEKGNRRFVPTRWSITAVHDIIGEEIKKEQIPDYPSVDQSLLFSFEHFGNHFEVILSPGGYSFELVEIWVKKSFWSPENTWIGYDREDIMKKKGYSVLSGGYYAARLPALEYMVRTRRKAAVTVIREIRPDYYAPLGVWVVEEGVRKALKTKPKLFCTHQEALDYCSKNLLTHNGRWLPYLAKERQSSLVDFFC